MAKKIYKVRQIYGNEEIRFDDFDRAIAKGKQMVQEPKSKGILIKEISYNDEGKVIKYESYIINKAGEVKQFEIK